MRHDAIDPTSRDERPGLTSDEEGERHGQNGGSSTGNTPAEAAFDLDGDEAASSKAVQSKPIAWRDLPRRDQLLILTLARLSEPLTQTSLQV